MSAGELRVEQASWQDEAERETIMRIRREVFVVEQNVPIDIELDGSDPSCRHLLAIGPAGEAVGTARMTANGHIGRIAVVSDWRERGVGSRLVDAMRILARESGLAAVDLDSQVHAIGFYEKLGFEICGDEFIEAGIRHQNMRCSVC